MAAQPPLHVTKTSSGNGIPAIPASAASLEPHPTDQERLLVEVRTIHANLVIRKKSSNNATDGRNVHFYVHGKSSFQIGLFDKLDIVRCLRKTLSSTPLADTLNRTSTCLSLLDVYAGVSNDLLISSPMLVDPKNRVFTAVTTAPKLYGSGYKVDDASDELATWLERTVKSLGSIFCSLRLSIPRTWLHTIYGYGFMIFIMCECRYSLPCLVSEFPPGMRKICMAHTMPWTICLALVVLWGVCWMFYNSSGPTRGEGHWTTSAPQQERGTGGQGTCPKITGLILC